MSQVCIHRWQTLANLMAKSHGIHVVKDDNLELLGRILYAHGAWNSERNVPRI